MIKARYAGAVITVLAGGVRVAAQTVAEARAAQGGAAPSFDELLASVFSDSFTWVLVLLFLIFWINMFCARGLLQRIPARRRGRMPWLLAALFLGPVIWGLHRLIAGKRRGPAVAGMAETGTGTGAVAQLPSMSLLTRDGQHIEARLGRKIASGLRDTLGLLYEATNKNASDIHLDTTEEGVRLALRIDGKLRPSEKLSDESGKRVMSVLKTAAGIDYANQQESRDGACTFMCGKRSYDLRVSRAWAVNGETVVVRALEAHGEEKTLEELGVPASLAPELRSLMAEQAGLIVVAGPTGSGKTTTLYSLLRCAAGDGRAILTIEDPVEYRIPEATQISLNPKVASTFAAALKTSMRHDCDIILVGEVRDRETLEVAFQAALTGHLVLTTLHASSINATLARLQQLGLNSFMVGAALRAIVCQRLVRRLCSECREPYIPEPGERERWGLSEELGPESAFFRPHGCEFCENTGFRGRIAVVHYVLLDRDMKDRLSKGEKMEAVLPELLERTRGQISDYVDELLLRGITSAEEFSSTLPMFGAADV